MNKWYIIGPKYIVRFWVFKLDTLNNYAPAVLFFITTFTFGKMQYKSLSYIITGTK